jgi:hypothetical protein
MDWLQRGRVYHEDPWRDWGAKYSGRELLGYMRHQLQGLSDRFVLEAPAVPIESMRRQREDRVWGTNGGTCERYAAGGLMWQSGPGALRKGYPDWGPVSEEEHAMA